MALRHALTSSLTTETFRSFWLTLNILKEKGNVQHDFEITTWIDHSCLERTKKNIKYDCSYSKLNFDSPNSLILLSNDHWDNRREERG